VSIDFEKTPLVPTVVQDGTTGEVRMVGYMDREAFDATRETGFLHFHSRSRGTLWKKGETSGNLHRVAGASLDCDGDAILVEVEAQCPTCHAGTRSCFSETLWGRGAEPGALGRLEAVIAARWQGQPEGSYTAKLFKAGTAHIAQKVGEEAVETVVASLSQSKERLVEESADLLYHLLVLWRNRDVTLEEVMGELDRRAGGIR
jgi:phosphoribosyl-AMP cyclohydrolase / phosphoribosyl-ATP pyrophosphohydrolase